MSLLLVYFLFQSKIIGTCLTQRGASASISFEIVDQPNVPIAQTITFTSPSTVAKGVGTSHAVTVSADSGLPVTVAVSGACSYNAAAMQVTVTSAAGTCAITGSQAGLTGVFLAAPNTTASFPTIKGTQTVSFNSTSKIERMCCILLPISH